MDKHNSINPNISVGFTGVGQFQEVGKHIATSGNNKSFIEKRISNLKKEAELLDIKIANMNTREDFGTYKNLIQVYSEILRLIERYDWELKYSEYTTGYDRQVAIWEQNGDGNIRNHKVWNVVPDVLSAKDYHNGRPL